MAFIVCSTHKVILLFPYADVPFAQVGISIYINLRNNTWEVFMLVELQILEHLTELNHIYAYYHSTLYIFLTKYSM